MSLDVALAPGNVLRGLTIDESGQATGHTSVFLFRDQEMLATGVSNEFGEFSIRNVRGGVYQLVAGDHVVSLRCWTAEAAPPQANSMVMVRTSDVMRGQIHPGSCLLANPWVVAGIIAAAIAIPVAIKANSDDRENGS